LTLAPARRERAAVLALLLLWGPAASAQAPPASGPEIRNIDIHGFTVYTSEQIAHIIRLHPGDRLSRDPSAIAANLEARYQIDGYIAAQVRADYDAASGLLRIAIDEGRLAEATVAGLSGAAQARAQRELKLEPGRLIEREAVLDALERLERVSGGAVRGVGDPPYRFERPPDGVRLVFTVERVPAQVAIGPYGPPEGSLYQRVDGFSLPFGAALTVHDLTSYNHLHAYARASYGFASKHARYALGLHRAFTGTGALHLGYEYHDLTATDDVFRASALEETLGTVLVMSSFRDYYRKHGHEAYAFLRLGGGRAQLGVDGRSDRYDSLAVTEDWSLLHSHVPRPNPPVQPGLMRSVIGSLRWSTGALFEGGADEAESLLLRDLYGGERSLRAALRLDTTFEIASSDAPGGDVTFHRWIAQLRGGRIVGPLSFDARLLGGLAGGTVPPQKVFALGGLGTLRGYAFKEFTGEQMLLGTLEASWDLPGYAPTLVGFYDGGVTATDGHSRDGWRDDLGLGLQWGPWSGVLLRIDGAAPLHPTPGHDGFRLTARLRAAF
jgi:hypothetical protein